MIEDYNDYSVSQNQIYKLAHRVKRRLLSIPQKVLSFDDIVQELSVAWVIAVDRFDPEMGIPWRAYLQTGMKNHINRVVEKDVERFKEQTFASSLDAPMGEDNSSTLGEIIEDTAVQASQAYEAKDLFEKAKAKMTSRARVFVEILNDPPQELLEELKIGQYKKAQAVKVGAPYNAPSSITSSMVLDLMGSHGAERTAIVREVKSFSQR